MVGNKRGHTPCKAFHSKNPHAGRSLWAQTSQMVGVGGTYLRRMQPFILRCRHSMHYIAGIDWYFSVQYVRWFVMWNIVSLDGIYGVYDVEYRWFVTWNIGGLWGGIWVVCEVEYMWFMAWHMGGL